MQSTIRVFHIINSRNSQPYVVNSLSEDGVFTVINLLGEYFFKVKQEVITNSYQEVKYPLIIQQCEMKIWSLCFTEDGILVVFMREIQDTRPDKEVFSKGVSKNCWFLKSGGICKFSGQLHKAPQTFKVILNDSQ